MEILKADIFKSHADILVNPTNCVGVMGKGLALEFKKRFPTNYAQYALACRRGIQPGEIFPVTSESKIIINFMTKDHWKNPSNLEWIDAGLAKLATWYDTDEYRKLCMSVPQLGCGLGGLLWEDVLTLMEKHLGEFENVRILIP